MSVGAVEKTKLWVLFLAVSGAISCRTVPQRQVTFKPTWNSLGRHTTPEWFKDAKFGIYTHWGVYSVPAKGPNGSWYPHNIYKKGTEQYEHHVKHYGHPSEVGYKDFIPMFKGAYYPHWVAEFDCSDPEYAGLYGPIHDRDVDWPEWYNISPDDLAFMQEQPSREFHDLWLAKLQEVIDNYQPDIIWFDGSLDRLDERYEKAFFVYYFNHALKQNKEVEVLFKGWDVPPGVAMNDLELGRMRDMTRHLWITDTSIDDMGAWSYAEEAGYKSVNTLVDNLVDRVSKNGMLLLNVGPKADGSIPEPARERLLAIGKWLEVNGEAIFGTRAWLIYGEGPTEMAEGGAYTEFEGETDSFYTGDDIRFTVKDHILYAICLDWPGEEVTINSLRRLEEEPSIYWNDDDIDDIHMLGVDKALQWFFNDEALVIQSPQERPCEYAYVFKIKRKKL
jgi:alpha-L-fucosidase